MLLDEEMEGVAVGSPATEPGVGAEGDDTVPLHGEVLLRGGLAVCQQRVDKTKQLHRPLILKTQTLR